MEKKTPAPETSHNTSLADQHSGQKTGDRQKKKWRHRVPVFFLFLFLALMPVLVLLSHRNTITALMLTGLFALLYPGILSEIWTSIRQAGWRNGRSAVSFWLLAFCSYVAVTLIWTPDLSQWSWAVQLPLFIVLGVAASKLVQALDPQTVRRLGLLFIGVTVVSCLLIGVEGFSGGMIRASIPNEGRPDKDMVAVARGAGFVLYMAIPVVFLLLSSAYERVLPVIARIALMILLTGSLGAGLFLTGITANVMAASAAIIAVGCARFWPSTTLRSVMMATVLVLAAAPLLAFMLPAATDLATVTALPVSWSHRLIAWSYTAGEIFSTPQQFLFGGGVRYSRWLSDTSDLIVIAGAPQLLPIMPSHPHNLFLQTWLEFGLLGVMLLITFLLTLFKNIHAFAVANTEKVIISSVIACFFIFAVVEMSLWTLWRFSALVFAIWGVALFRRLIS